MKNKIINFLRDQVGYSEDFAKMVVAVSAFETNDWKSTVYRRNHNLFGMKHPKVRSSTSLGEREGFAYYNNNINSLWDFVYYLRYFGYSGAYGIDLYKFIQQMHSKGYFKVAFYVYYKGVSARYEKLFGVESRKFASA